MIRFPRPGRRLAFALALLLAAAGGLAQPLATAVDSVTIVVSDLDRSVDGVDDYERQRSGLVLSGD